MRSKNWKSCCQRWTSKMIEKVKNTTNNVLLRMEFYKFKEKSTIWWKNWWKRVDAKGGAGRWRQIRSFAVLQIVPLLLAGKGSRLAWKYLALIRKTTFFPNFEHSFCSRCQGGRSCAGAWVAHAEKFGLGRKFEARTYAILSRIKIYALFWRSLGKKSSFLGQKQCFLGNKCTITW